MPRKRREESPTGVYHWIVRGMNRKKLFHKAKDYRCFEDLLLEYKAVYDIKVYHYCYMSNHVHLLVKANDLESLAGFSQYVQRRYAYRYCGEYKWNGSVFQRGYKSFVIDKEAYLLECARYIERNPIKAKMVENVGDYCYSSYNYYAEGEAALLITPSPAFISLGSDVRCRQALYKKYVTEIRVQEEMLERGIGLQFENI